MWQYLRALTGREESHNRSQERREQWKQTKKQHEVWRVYAGYKSGAGRGDVLTDGVGQCLSIYMSKITWITKQGKDGGIERGRWSMIIFVKDMKEIKQGGQKGKESIRKLEKGIKKNTKGKDKYWHEKRWRNEEKFTKSVGALLYQKEELKCPIT